MKNEETILYLQKLLTENSYKALREAMIEENEVDIAEFIGILPKDKAAIVFRLLPKDLAAEVFSNLELDVQERLIHEFTDKELESVLEEMFVDDLVDMLEELPAGIVKRVLRNTDEGTRGVINAFLKYPKDSAGTIMTAEYTNLRPKMTVKEAILYLRKNGADSETLYNCYVIDKNRVLDGVVSLRTLLLSKDDVLVEDLMETDVVKVHTSDDKEEVAYLFQRYDYLSLPVVDSEERLVGIITVDDIIDVMEEETTEDFELMAATIPSGKPYLKTPSWELARNRIVWLTVLMLSGMISGGILSRYEEAFTQIPVLVSFIPMLMNTGGNAGSQASTLVIRGMVLNEISLKDGFVVLWKEFRVSLIAGLFLAVINFIRLIITYPGQERIMFVVSFAIFGTVVIAKMVGGILPLFAKLLKADPAIMAAPLITTIVDALSLIFYFFLAGVFLGIS